MGRYTGPKNKLARRYGVDLGLKQNSSKVARRLTQAPGVHGASRRPASSSFGKQLVEKQKAKFVYGLRDTQLRRLVNLATSMTGDSGMNLMQLLEKRMDNVVYRLGFAGTRAQARQMVTHNMFTLNGKKMNIASHLVSVGDIVALKPNKAKSKLFDGLEERLQAKNLPSWVSVDPSAKTGKILNEPAQADLEHIFDVTQIIEFYSTR
jgi:small subunit ribosomal protein S4